MDPLDPITEIIKSGQAFSYAITLERILWKVIGFFFLGAILTSITKGMKHPDWFGTKSFLSSFKSNGFKDDVSDKLSDE